MEAGKNYPLRRDIQEKVRKGVEQYESGKMNSELPPAFEEVDEETSTLPEKEIKINRKKNNDIKEIKTKTINELGELTVR